MADKPNDFFVSVINFFGIVLPGSLLCYLLMVLFGAETNNLPYIQQSPGNWIAFIVVSYLLGHFVSLAGALLDEHFDSSYVLKNLRHDPQPFTLARQVISALSVEQPKKNSSERGEPEDKLTLGEAKSVTRWANTFIRLASQDASLQLDQLEADSKFFRSLSVVLFISFVFYSVSARFGSIASLYPRILFYIMFCPFLLLLSLWRYANLRWKRTRLSYEFLVALNRSGKLKLISERIEN